ncbi:MAG: hypothetical protein VCA36_05595, partial [Opitutales bacterium]
MKLKALPIKRQWMPNFESDSRTRIVPQPGFANGICIGEGKRGRIVKHSQAAEIQPHQAIAQLERITDCVLEFPGRKCIVPVLKPIQLPH